MVRKTLISLLIAALLWLSGCMTYRYSAYPTSFGPCDMRMNSKYCGP